MYRFSLLMFFGFISANICAQKLESNNWYTEVHLKNGSILKGGLQKESNDTTLILMSREEIKFSIPTNSIKKIVQKETGMKIMKPYLFKERGWYNITSTSLNIGYNVESDKVTGYGLETVTGLLLNRYIGFGCGIGYIDYADQAFKGLIPIFLETRGYVFGKQNSYYYSIAGGYSWGFKNSERAIYETPGGWMFHPALGIRFGARSHFNVSLDMGIRFQQSIWFYEPDNSWVKNEKYEYLYKRFIIRLGLQI